MSGKVEALADNPRPQDARELKGHSGDYRVDSGEYRILYTIDDAASVVTIWRIKHRREVYRRL